MRVPTALKSVCHIPRIRKEEENSRNITVRTSDLKPLRSKKEWSRRIFQRLSTGSWQPLHRSLSEIFRELLNFNQINHRIDVVQACPWMFISFITCKATDQFRNKSVSCYKHQTRSWERTATKEMIEQLKDEKAYGSGKPVLKIWKETRSDERRWEEYESTSKVNG